MVNNKYNLYISIVNLMTSFILVKILVLFAPQQDFANWSLINSYSSILLVFIGLNSTHYLGLSLAKNRCIDIKILKLILKIVVIMSIFCIIFTILLDKYYLLIILFFAIVRFGHSCYRTIFIFTNKIQKYFYFEIVINTLKIIIFIITFLSTRNFLLSIYLAFTLSMLVAFFIIKPKFRKVNSKKYIGNKEILKICLPLMFSSLIFVFIQSSDKMILNYYGLSNDIAFYSGALIFQTIIFLLVGVFDSSLAFKLYSTNGNRREIGSIFLENTSIIWFLAIFMMVFSRIIILTFLSTEYLIISDYIPVVIFTSILYYYYLSYSRNLLVINKSRTSLFITSVGLILNIALNLLLIPQFGYVGCIFSSLFSYTLMVLITTIIVLRIYPKHKLFFKAEIRQFGKYMSFYSLLFIILSQQSTISQIFSIFILFVLGIKIKILPKVYNNFIRS